MAKKLSVASIFVVLVFSVVISGYAYDEREDWDTPVLFSEVRGFGEVGLSYCTPEGFTHRSSGWFVTFTSDHQVTSEDLSTGLRFAVCPESDDEDRNCKQAKVGEVISSGKTVLITREINNIN